MRSLLSRLDAERISEASKNRDLKARLSHLGHRAAGPNKSSRKRGARRIKDMREQRHSAISNSKRMGTIDSTHAPSIEITVGWAGCFGCRDRNMQDGHVVLCNNLGFPSSGGPTYCFHIGMLSYFAFAASSPRIARCREELAQSRRLPRLQPNAL